MSHTAKKIYNFPNYSDPYLYTVIKYLIKGSVRSQCGEIITFIQNLFSIGLWKGFDMQVLCPFAIEK